MYSISKIFLSVHKNDTLTLMKEWKITMKLNKWLFKNKIQCSAPRKLKNHFKENDDLLQFYRNISFHNNQPERIFQKNKMNKLLKHFILLFF